MICCLEQGIEFSNYEWIPVYFWLALLLFAFYIYSNDGCRNIYNFLKFSWWIDPLALCRQIKLMLWFLKSLLSDKYGSLYTVQHHNLVIFAWNIFFHPFTLSLLAAAAAAVKLLQSCPTLCDLIDSSPPGSSVPGIFQARILEWVAISFSPVFAYPGVK